MGIGLPDIAPEERTPLVVALLEVIRQQGELIQQLRDEIAVLKGQKPRPQIQPSRLEKPPPPDPAKACCVCRGAMQSIFVPHRGRRRP